MDQNELLEDKQESENTVFITVDQMAKMMSVARITAYQLTKTKEFPCFYIGKRIIIPLSSFNEWVKKQAENKSTILEVGG